MKKLIQYLCVGFIGLIASYTAYAEGSFDENAWYRLTSQWQGACESLDIVNDGISNDKTILAQTKLVSGQLWKIKSLGNGYYRLSTQWQGQGKSLSVDSDSPYNNYPMLDDTENSSEQSWKISTIYGEYFRISNLQLGTGKSLDIVNDGINNNKPIMANTGNYSGQFWKIKKVTTVTTPPAALNLDPFYKKYLDADGIPVVSSNLVPDLALYKAQYMAMHMLTRMPAVRDRMIANNAKIAVMADTEVTTDIPEHAYLKNDPNVDWDQRARGLGGTLNVPTSSCAEENLLCYSADQYFREDIFIHEFAHTIHNLGLALVYPTFNSALQAAYDNAVNVGLWRDTYAISNSVEYFAEGVQTWFNVNAEVDPPNGIHNDINTREELKTYDPMLYNLISLYFPHDTNSCSCHVP